ncbi:hypothetical protein [Sorangium sp. So ce1000]|uniref:hypothetical protein n=1 Tax=Sorangium sp. So ce1000 TaxID=3133325 RepID=UPI003F5DCF43
MNRHLVLPVLSLAAAALVASGCHAQSPAEGSLARGRKPTNQIDVGGYVITAAGRTVGGAYAVQNGNSMTEFWVRSYWPKVPPITITGASPQPASCAAWWSSICGLSNGVYYTTTVTPQTPVCPTPPEPNTPRAAFLWAGDFQIQGPSKVASAWIHVDGTGEYWAMDEEINVNGGALSLTTANNFSSYSTFGTYACQQQPSAWFTPSYSKRTVAGPCNKNPPPGCSSQ